ncbi:unnamed protein product [Closterium sp. NIES-54]
MPSTCLTLRLLPPSSHTPSRKYHGLYPVSSPSSAASAPLLCRSSSHLSSSQEHSLLKFQAHHPSVNQDMCRFLASSARLQTADSTAAQAGHKGKGTGRGAGEKEGGGRAGRGGRGRGRGRGQGVAGRGRQCGEGEGWEGRVVGGALESVLRLSSLLSLSHPVGTTAAAAAAAAAAASDARAATGCAAAAGAAAIGAGAGVTAGGATTRGGTAADAVQQSTERDDPWGLSAFLGGGTATLSADVDARQHAANERPPAGRTGGRKRSAADAFDRGEQQRRGRE